MSSDSTQEPHLSIIVPAYNEQARIEGTLASLVEYLSGRDFDWEIVIADDGSDDGTADLAEMLADGARVRLLRLAHRGKGAAVREGMISARGRYRMMCDADLAMPVAWIGRLLEATERGHDIVIGSRQIAGAHRFNEPAARHVMGRIFNWCVRAVAVRGLEDTQCGFKCFTRQAADRLFPLQRSSGFGFDVELLYLAARAGMRVAEIPIDWYHQPESKVRPFLDPALMLRDAAAVRVNWAIGRYRSLAEIDRPAGPAAGPASSGLPRVTVVVPTYNEADNLPELAGRIFALEGMDLRVLIVDDGSPDGTGRIAREISETYGGRIDVLQRPSKLGLGSAYRAGFAAALSDGPDFVFQMDADLSHPPGELPAMLAALASADVVVGSRYLRGLGRVDAEKGWGTHRILISSLGNLAIRTVAGLRVRDATSGFKGFRAAALRDLRLEETRCRGFGFQSEVAFACQHSGYTVVEHPFVFAIRAGGKSKMSAAIVGEAMWRLTLLRLRSLLRIGGFGSL